MKLDMTKNQLKEKIYNTTADTLIDFLVNEGLTLKKELPEIQSGLYRRVEGKDMARYDGYGNWFTIDLYGPVDGRKIAWSLDPRTPDWWVLVLDRWNAPVIDGFTVLMDHAGERVG